MLTRLEVNGFKNLLNFSADFGPYTCIAGPNAVGKSNIFDSVEFLSLLATMSFVEAAQELRAAGQKSGDPGSLFWRDSSGEYSDMTLAAEMLVPPTIEDDFGRITKPTTTFLRYEITLRYILPSDEAFARFGRIALRSESLTHIKKSDAPQRLQWPHRANVFRNSVVLGRRSGIAYISTRVDDAANVVVEVHQDGPSRGRPRPSPADRAPRTIVATTTTSDDPTILAARREMQSWRKVALEPSAMRTPDEMTDPANVASNGAHLAAALYRLAIEQGEDVYARIATRASSLVDVHKVGVDVDLQRDLLTLEAQIGSGPMLPARALSDGTLRFIALCILLQDPSFHGVMCMEEPENGIHPAKMEAMVELLRDLAVNPNEAPSQSNPLRQVLVNTHSPFLVVLQSDAELLVARSVSVKRPDGSIARTVRLLPMPGGWRKDTPFKGGKQSIIDYLNFPDDAPQLVNTPASRGFEF
ncbi:AAA family ATPase [Rathayibacter rathayi]|nr:AAA family ATPase [Rathayibacter rathayi]